MSGFQRPRGTRDFPPEEMEQRRFVESKLRQVAHSFNFGEVMTPTFENTELFIAKSGPAIIDEIYAFKDKGDREISLRPELTAAVMRYYVNELHTRPKPLKLYYMGNCFRYERPQKGRYREFFQFGAEIIGARSLEADAEILALAHACVMGSGAKISDFRIGHLGILEALFNKYEIAKGFQTNIRRYLDKRDFDSMFTYFSKSSLDPAALDALTEIVGVQGSPSHVIKKAEDYLSEDCDPIIYLKDLIERLNAYGIQDNQVSIDLGVARGLDYYTGMVFEIDAASLGAESQVCGGGAYSLSETFGGQKIFSTGFAFGFDRLMLAREQNDGAKAKLDTYFIPVSDKAKIKCVELASELRENGISADIDLLDRKMGKALGYANTIGAVNAVIIGDKELVSKKAMVKVMDSGEQVPVEFSKLLDYFQE